MQAKELEDIGVTIEPAARGLELLDTLVMVASHRFITDLMTPADSPI